MHECRRQLMLMLALMLLLPLPPLLMPDRPPACNSNARPGHAVSVPACVPLSARLHRLRVNASSTALLTTTAVLYQRRHARQVSDRVVIHHDRARQSKDFDPSRRCQSLPLRSQLSSVPPQRLSRSESSASATTESTVARAHVQR